MAHYLNMTVAIASQYDLTEQQARFVVAMARGAPEKLAASSAGYSEDNFRHTIPVLLRSPQILLAIQSEVRRRLVTFAPTALGVLEHLAEHATSEKVRADCSKDLLNRAGLVAPRAAAPGTGEKPLHELAVVELRAMADRLQGEIEARAKPVNAPNAPAQPGQVSDLIG